MQAPITVGFFDSGVGGLSVWREVTKKLPNVNTIYVADRAYFPYGKKSATAIRARSIKIMDFLIDSQCDLAVVACNTASAAALDFLKAHYSIPIVGLEPTVKPAVAMSKNHTVAVLTTPVTARSLRYKLLIKAFGSGSKVITAPCPGLADSIERGSASTLEIEKVLEACLSEVKRSKPDVVALGCTHYPLIKNLIKKHLKYPVKIIDSGEAVANRVASLLNHGDAKAATTVHQFYSTADSSAFKKTALGYFPSISNKRATFHWLSI